MNEEVVDLVGHLRASVDAARERRRTGLVAPATEPGNQAADEGAQVGSPVGVETPAVRACAPNSPSAAEGSGTDLTAVPEPPGCLCGPDGFMQPTTDCRVHFPSRHQLPGDFTREEYDEITGAIYNRLWDDPTRIPDCFAIAYAALGTFAVAEPGLDGEYVRREAAQAIRRMMRRVLDGELQAETEDHR